jgi:hypothetical protein
VLREVAGGREDAHAPAALEGGHAFEHTGGWSGRHAGVCVVPERQFAMIVLTNSDTGRELRE